jgi:predicted nucleotidyltransferase
MKTLEEIKKSLRDQKPTLAAKYTVKELGIFGSYIRGEQELDSDIDILIDFEEYPSLLEFVGIEDELSKALGIKVDLVMKSGLKPRLGRRILREVIYL